MVKKGNNESELFICITPNNSNMELNSDKILCQLNEYN